MTLRVIGAGVGRTGTYSLRLAINQLGFGPCYHMSEVRQNMQVQVPLWNAALRGNADWHTIYSGFSSTVDWPTARYFRELCETYPAAKFILTHRSSESWADSFLATIYRAMAERAEAPPEMREWLEMVTEIVAETGFPLGLAKDDLQASFVAHNEAVKATIPADRLLEFEVKAGWGPLCEFLEMPVPNEPFPRSNHREEFWERVAGNS